VTDYVSIRDLSVAAVIGVHPWEREIEQTLVVCVEIAADVAKAAASDELADALDYSAVAETVATVLREGKFRLIETAAERIAGRLLADFPLSWLRLELRKPIASAPATLVPGATPITTAPVTPAPAYTAVIIIERGNEISLSGRIFSLPGLKIVRDHVRALPARPRGGQEWGWRDRRRLL
jgi:7,8-dihydroneopterin aldolase/epimerase/oxygenase